MLIIIQTNTCWTITDSEDCELAPSGAQAPASSESRKAGYGAAGACQPGGFGGSGLSGLDT